jgi:hypothetical protein
MLYGRDIDIFKTLPYGKSSKASKQATRGQTGKSRPANSRAKPPRLLLRPMRRNTRTKSTSYHQAGIAVKGFRLGSSLDVTQWHAFQVKLRAPRAFNGKITLAAMHFRREFESTVVTSPAPQAKKLGMGLRLPCLGQTFSRRRTTR